MDNHEAVYHSVGEYVRGKAHTNGIESFWSMLKRGYHGVYHQMSPKHLQRYVNEFAGRHNLRSWTPSTRCDWWWLGWSDGDCDTKTSPRDMVELDQFYTQPHIAKRCWDVLNSTVDTSLARFIEPSAGTGVFYDLLPEGSIGIDIDPQHDNLIEADFLGWGPDRDDPSNTVIVGNPPFGSRGRMAVRFFNHAAVIAETVAFIVPVIFRKYFIHKQLPPTGT